MLAARQQLVALSGVQPAGVPIAVVSKRLGHSTISLTLDTYSHLLQASAGTLPSAPLHSYRGL